MKTDSTAAPKIENAYLDISTEKSILYGEKEKRFYHSTSDGNQEFHFWTEILWSNSEPSITYSIRKIHATKTISYKDRIARDQHW